MNVLNAIGMMRNEAMLLSLLLILIIAEIASGEEKRHVSLIAIGGMLLISVIGFFEKTEGLLFGGMFIENDMTQLMKGILNLGTFVVFLQSMEWVSKVENKVRTTEFFALLIATLIGMNFLICRAHW